MHRTYDARIFLKECVSLSKAGYDVSLIVRNDNDCEEKGVRIIAARIPGNRFERITRTVRDVHRQARMVDADVYHLHDPELIPVGILLRCRGKKIIYDAHEDLPKQILSKPWIVPFLRSPLSRAARLVLAIASRFLFAGIVAATPEIRKTFPSSKTVLVRNFPLLDELAGGGGGFYAGRPPHIAYTGGISKIRGIREIVRSVELTSNEAVRLQLAGVFETDGSQDEVSRMAGWKRVDFAGWRSREQMYELLSKVRAGLVLFHPKENHVDALPNKMFEYMAAGIPVIASNFDLWKEILERNGFGLCVDPLNPKEIAEATDWVMAHEEEAEIMGKNGRRAIEKEYNWENELTNLLHLYDEVLS